MPSYQLRITAPFDGAVIEELDLESAEAVEAKLTVARALADRGEAQIPSVERGAILNRAADLMEARTEEWARAATREGGKPLRDSKAEVTHAVRFVRETAQVLADVDHEEALPGAPQGGSFTIREPVGVVAAIAAFHHPVYFIVRQVVPAVAAGCPVVVRPALATPRSCLNVVSVLRDAGLPADWCQTLICSEPEAEQLAADVRVDLLQVAGSDQAGAHLRARLGPETRCVLEPVGSAVGIIASDADLSATIAAVTRGVFYHAGQAWRGVQRIFVQETITEAFLAGLVASASALQVGDPLEEATEVGPLLLAREVARVQEWIEAAVKDGAKLRCGGEAIGFAGCAPAVLLGPPGGRASGGTGPVGPVVVVEPFSDMDEAVRRVNQTPILKQAALFVRDPELAQDTAMRLRAPKVTVNAWSCFGADGIPAVMEALTNEKLVVFKSCGV